MAREIQVRGLDHFHQRLEPAQGGDIGFTVVLNDWDGTSAIQCFAGDFRPTAQFGSNDADNPVYAAGMMGNVLSTANLARTENIIAGVIGKISYTGTNASVWPSAGVIGEIEATGNYAIMAAQGADSNTTYTPTAFYGVSRWTGVTASIPDFGLDLRGTTPAAYPAVAYGTGDIRFSSGGILATFTTAITANVTTTALAAGTIGKTTNATGRSSIFISDGTKWQFLVNA